MSATVAFNLTCVFDRLSNKVECIEAWGDNTLLIGTKEGTILKYVIKPTPGYKPDAVQTSAKNGKGENPLSPFTAICDDSSTQHKGRAILKMIALEALGVLVVMASDGVITVHDLSRGFPLRSVLPKTKGCTCMSVSETNVTPGQDVILCAGLKKKILLFQWDYRRTKTFTELRELSVINVPNSITIADTNLIVAFPREFVAINMFSGEAKALFTIAPNQGLCATRYGRDNILVLRDRVTVFLTMDGSPKREEGIPWTTQPSAFVCASPFVYALENERIEVKMLSATANEFVAFLSLKGAKAITCKTLSNGTDHICYAATERALYRIMEPPLPSFIDLLVKTEAFDAALALCDYLPETDSVNAEKANFVRISYAFFKFNKGQFRESLDLLQELNTNPLEIIALYCLLPKKYKLTTQVPLPDTSDVMNKTTKNNAYRALQAYLIQKHNEVCTPELIEQSIEAAPQEIEAEYDNCTSVATIIDTTLLKVCADLKDDHLKSFCSNPNCCHVNEGAKVLTAAKLDKELVLFYGSKGLHAYALKVFSCSDQLKDTIHVIEYLRNLGASSKDLVFSHAQRLFKDDPTKALTIFVENKNVGTPNELPRMEVLNFLKVVCKKKVIPYLEFLVANGETDSVFHDELASEYVTNIIDSYDAIGGFPTKKPYPEPGREPGDIGKYRADFLHFLQTSQYYRPQALITGNKIPVFGLFEERATVLSRLNNHEQVLAIYALDLEDSAKAEEYCRIHMNEDKENCKELYLTLFKVYLNPPASVPPAPPRPTEPMIEPALKLLSEHYQNIPIKDALKLLPASTKLSALMPFFTLILGEGARRRRDGQLVSALLKSESQRVREDYIGARSPCVYIDENTVCHKCHRPLRTSAFVRYPQNGQIFHLMCHQKTESEAAAAATMNETLADNEPFDNTMDLQELTGMAGSTSPSLFSNSPTPQFGGSIAASQPPSFLSVVDDYSPESAGVGTTPGVTSSNPFDDNYGGGF